MLFNYVPTSGHPGGSISSGRIVMGILFDTLDYDVSDPYREDADIISFAAGHKTMGLYSLWAMRNEVMRICKPDLLPSGRSSDPSGGPVRVSQKPDSQHAPDQEAARQGPRWPSHAGDALCPSLHRRIWRRIGKFDRSCHRRSRLFRKRCPYGSHRGRRGWNDARPGERGPGCAGTSSLRNVILHVDWNQASIDSNHVCREGEKPGRLRPVESHGARLSP